MSVQKTNANSRCYVDIWKQPLQLALILLLCMSAMGCLKRGTVRTEGVPPEALELLNPLPAFDPNLLQPGPESLPEAKSDDVPTLTRNHIESANIYHDLRLRNLGLILQAQERQQLEGERIERARKAIDRKK